MTIFQVPEPPSCLPGDLDQLSVTQGNFAAIADASGRVRSELLNAGGQIVWSGQAYNAFESTLSNVPHDLQKVQASFGAAANALRTYLSMLSALMPQYQSVYKRYVDCYQQLQGYNRQLANIAPGLDVSGLIYLEQDDSQSQLKGRYDKSNAQEMKTIYDHLGNLSDEMAPLYNELGHLYMEGVNAANALTSALNEASAAGIQDNWSNTFERYGGDVAGFVVGVVTGLAHDVEELVAALVNLDETYAKMLQDIAEGKWSAVGKDLDQMLYDINDICHSLSAILMTLTPILQFIPGVGEIVDVLDIIVLVASVLSVATDVGMIVAGGSADDPLTGQSVNLRKAGEGSIVSDSVGLVLSELPGGGGVLGDSVEDSATDAVKDWQTDLGDAFKEGDFEKVGDLAKKMDYKFEDLAPEAKFGDISDYRSFIKDEADRAEAKSLLNPTVIDKFGIKMSYNTFSKISVVVTAGSHGYSLGHDLYNWDDQDSSVDAAGQTIGIVHDVTLGG